jgi:hypothetical protein
MESVLITALMNLLAEAPAMVSDIEGAVKAWKAANTVNTKATAVLGTLETVAGALASDIPAASPAPAQTMVHS